MYNNRKFIGFEFLDANYKEYLPKSEQVYTKEQKRALFISMFNFYMPKELRFKKNEFSTNKTLLNIFTCKIKSLIPISFTGKHTIRKEFKIDTASTIIINNFLSVSGIAMGRFLTKCYTCNLKIINKTPNLLLAKWIKLIHVNNQLRILFDLNDIFSNLVYERIKKANRDKKVTYQKNGISIMGIDNDNTSTFVVPCFSSFDINKMSIKTQVDFAHKEIQSKKHNQVYFVYPKSTKFKKHIELKLPEATLDEDEYKVKLVPYSFAFCIKNIKGEKLCK